MRVGIFFGGPAREREISYAGGKTAFAYLDKSLFQPVPVFVDSFGRFILLREQWMYQTSIRDFYPSPEVQKEGFSCYVESFPDLRTQPIDPAIGQEILPHEFSNHFDFVFLAMHGPDCEDGAIQGLLEWYRIPYSGPGLMGSAVGIDKVLQNNMIALVNRQQKPMVVLSYATWQQDDRRELFRHYKAALGLPIVIKAPHQGSSIGVAFVKHDEHEAFERAINQCFFQVELSLAEWGGYSMAERHAWAQRMANLNEGIGFPVIIEGQEVYHPTQLIELLNSHATQHKERVTIASAQAEDQVLLEAFVEGQEFSCGCIQLDSGKPLALPPTEVVKVVEVFDFDAKYKSGTTRKRIPVETSLENNQRIRAEIASVFEQLGMNVCTRIDGFLTPDGRILLHDPNTIPGMSPSSLIFKQMAELGLSVSQSITYFIRQSLRERIRTGKATWSLRKQLVSLDKAIKTSLKNTRLVYLVAEPKEEAFAALKHEYGLLSAVGNPGVCAVLHYESHYYTLTPPLLAKESLAELVPLLHQPRHPLLEETCEQGEEITQFYTGRSFPDLVSYTQLAALPSCKEAEVRFLE